jgi:hypothetical protein
MDDNNFDKLIKEKIENYSMPVSDKAWVAIENSLNAKPHKVIRWLWIPEIAVAASIFVGLFLWTDKENTICEPNTSNLVSIPQQTEIEEQTTDTYLKEENKELVAQIRQDRIVHKKTKTILTHPETKDSGKETVRINTTAQNTRPEKTSENPNHKQPVEKTIASNNDLADNLLSVNNKNTYQTQRSMGLFLGSMDDALAMRDNDVPNRRFSSEQPLSEKLAYMAPRDISKAQNLLDQEVFPDVTHYAPVSIGISFRKELNQVFALESGLVYTYIASEFENQNTNKNAKLQLHYVGIPLNLHTRIYGNRNSNWNIYFSTGGMVEKGVLSHYVQKEYYAANNYRTITSNEKIDGLQWSLSASPGLNYKLNKTYSLYFEPKISYYFDNNQPVSARTEHPVVIGLNAGVRFNW